VLETSAGFHILKLEDRIDADKLEQVGRRSVAHPLYTGFRAAELAEQFAKELLEAAAGGKGLEEATRELATQYASKGPHGTVKKDQELPALEAESRPRVEISAPFNLTGAPIPNATFGHSPAARAFELKQDEMFPEPVPTRDGLAVMQLKEKEPASRDDFEKDKTAILRSMRHAKMDQALIRFVERLRELAGDKVKISTSLVRRAGDQADGDPEE
jgi:peptidyl-prolyl cis-trans isomerase D